MVNFDEGIHHRKPSESGWARLKHSPHAMIVEVGGVVKTTSLNPQLSPLTRGLESYNFLPIWCLTEDPWASENSNSDFNMSRNFRDTSRILYVFSFSLRNPTKVRKTTMLMTMTKTTKTTMMTTTTILKSYFPVTTKIPMTTATRWCFKNHSSSFGAEASLPRERVISVSISRTVSERIYFCDFGEQLFLTQNYIL